MKVSKYKLNGQWDVKTQANDLVLFFGNDDQAFKSLKELCQDNDVVGCSVASVADGDSISNDSLAVVISLEKSTYKIISKSVDYDSSYLVGKQLRKELDGDELKGILVFSEGLKTNGAKLCEGLHSENKNNVPIAGGMAADELKFESTWCYHNKKLEDSVVAIAFYGNIHFNIGSGTGMKSFGIERNITKAEKNVLYEIDGQPALELFKKYLGEEESAKLPASALRYPVEISRDFERDEGLVRTPIMVSEEDQSITFTGEIPQGKKLRLLRADLDELVDKSAELSESLDSIDDSIKGSNLFNLVISCAARKIVLEDSVEEELHDFHDKVTERGGTQAGIYAYGEMSFVNNQLNFLNQTLTYISMYEDVADQKKVS